MLLCGAYGNRLPYRRQRVSRRFRTGTAAQSCERPTHVDRDVERKVITMLKLLGEARAPLGARVMSRMLRDYDIELTERAVRYHLKLMDGRGLTFEQDRHGRVITDKGREELANALVTDKVGFVIAKIDSLTYQTDFDVDTKRGNVVLNLSFIPEEDFPRALKVMAPVFAARLCLSPRVAVAAAGDKVGSVTVPHGKVGLGTVCSVTLNGILSKMAIPVESRFGGILQVVSGRPVRFTELITYEGSSVDPLEIFIKSNMSSVIEAADTGNGKILAGFREVPAVCMDEVRDLFEKLKTLDIVGLLAMGRSGQPLFEVPVPVGRCGIVIAGGLNPLAAVGEAGIEAEDSALATLALYEDLEPFADVWRKMRGEMTPCVP